MVNQSSREFFYFKVPVFIIDIALLLSVFLLLVRLLPPECHLGLDGALLGVCSLLVVSFAVVVGVVEIRLHERRIRPSVVFSRAVRMAVLTYFLFTVLVMMVYKTSPRMLLGLGLVCSIFAISIWHYIANKIVRGLRKLGRNTRHVVIVGADVTAGRVCAELLRGKDVTGYVVSGYFSSLEQCSMPGGVKFLGPVEGALEWLNDNRPDELYCSLPPTQCHDMVNKLIQWCNDNFIEFYFVPTMDGYPHRKLAIRDLGSVTVFKLRPEPLNNPFSKFVKRLFDIIISLLFLCTLYPIVFMFVWIGDVVTGSKGPVYFRQLRTGYNGHSFKIFKFRSMKINDEADTLQATADDPRKTRFGDFLRRTSIDELPQFINVLLGDMSIVGPRPHMEHHTEIYSGLINDYMVRHLAKPGITGWAQVNGCRGETKTLEEMENRVKHDIWYIEHWTPVLDMEIILRTCWQILPGHDEQAY
ncbi:MAG: exopolysaccharide biosynthesis polyprenyl glycosylphosphotransferase [Bacteroidales bacterium]|nr:exopolysaccharide biosynthesis polyprenyl glycosylphosphotransferase [Candidatus Cryptobacteroides choladohippi]